MNSEQIAFAERYRRFLRLMDLLVRLMPRLLYPVLTRTLGRWLNPYRSRAHDMQRAMQIALEPAVVPQAWTSWLDSHTRFVLDFLSYSTLDKRWLQRAVVVENPALLEALRQNGGLLLTYHMHHQNTMCCALGLAGCKVSAIAAIPEDSPMFAYIGRWAQQLNANSERHFQDGRYIFTNEKRMLARSIRQCLTDKSTLVCLCDLHQPSVNGPVGYIFGRRISPPKGTIEMALRHNVPIFAAMFAPHRGRLRLQLRVLDTQGGGASVVAGYLAFLESCALENPCCWQGWEWLAEMAVTDNQPI